MNRASRLASVEFVIVRSLDGELKRVETRIVFNAVTIGYNRTREIGAVAEIGDEWNTDVQQLSWRHIVSWRLVQHKSVSAEYLNSKGRPHKNANTNPGCFSCRLQINPELIRPQARDF